jgi:hypothetical protein
MQDVFYPKSCQTVEGSASAGKERKGLAVCSQIVAIFYGAVGADLFFIGEVQTALTIEVLGVA